MTEITVYSRDKWRSLYLRSFQIRSPGADVREGTQPYNDAADLADQLVVQSGNAQRIALAQLLSGKFGADLDQYGNDIGVPRPDATGSIGYAIMGPATSAVGTTPTFGQELVDQATGLSFRFTGNGTYVAEDPFPVAANSTGPGTNLDPDAVLVWSAPPPGCDPFSTVQEQPDGTGLTGGRERATDEEYQGVIRDAQSNPSSAGNDGEYQRLIEFSIGHGVQVEKAFTYPAIFGPGTTAWVFTLKPSRVGASRIPNAAQIAAVSAYVGEKMPADDNHFGGIISRQNRDIYLKIDWVNPAEGWEDIVTWPPYYSTTASGSPATVVVDSATSSTAFILETLNANYTAVVHPVAGTTIAFFDQSKGVFRRKKILTVVGTGPWTITCDTTSAASDTSYTPAVGQPCCPWSDSLDLIVSEVATYVGTLGPGEQKASFFDEGNRQRRNPRPPKFWSHTFTNRVERGVEGLAAVSSVKLAEGDDGATTVGTPALESYLQELRYLTAFPKS